MQVKQAEKCVETSVILCDLVPWHLVDTLTWLENVVVFAILRYQAQLLVVIVFEKIGSNSLDLRETCLSIELDKVIAL